ncbi:protein NDUFAF4 homolog [Venturia canescens]|uniref:protein NDUFAF4 homolog n=1 Tax=Venturia canescens TaxID=32260 RepID=UPI001C9D10DF|nr:protein NDUFAF4 homolog [Venturia canescens]
MGKAMSAMTRPLKTFNIENRARKVISQDKPVPAPTFKSTQKQLEVAKTINPSFMEEHYKKDPKLDQRLKNVYVSSQDIPLSEQELNPERPLPKLTSMVNEFEYGFWEPEEASEGRCTLRMVLNLLTDHMNDPEKNSAQEMATKYKLNEKDVVNLTEYFRVYKVAMPQHEKMDISCPENMKLPKNMEEKIRKNE